MALMVSPDGRESVEVPESDIPHYQKLGAKLVNHGSGPRPSFTGQYQGTPDEGLIQEQPIENAMALAGGVGLARAAPGLIRAGAAAAGPAARGVGKMLGAVGRAAGRRTFGKGNFDDLAKDTVAAAKTMRPGAAAADGATQTLRSSAASQALPVAEAATAPLTPAARVQAIKPLRANASPDARTSHRIELEAAMSEAKLDASARRAIRETMGHGAPKPASAPRETPKLEAVPRPSRPMRGASKPELERRAAALEKVREAGKPRPSLPKPKEAVTERPKHDVQFYSKAEGKHTNIETLDHAEVADGIKDLTSRNPRPDSVAKRQLDALRTESRYRQSVADKIGRNPDATYASASRGSDVKVSEMNQKHIEQAYNKLARTKPKPGSAEAHQLENLMNESKYREMTTGIHIGQGR